MPSELTNQIEAVFSELENHNSYFIRKRVYMGEGGKFGNGLYPVHQKFKQIIARLKEVSDEQLKPNIELLDSVQIKLFDTIRLVAGINGMTDSTINIINYISLAEHEVDDLDKVVDKIENYNPTTDKSDPEISSMENIARLRGIVEDNLNQLPKSFQWKEAEKTDEGKQLMNKRWQLMLEAKMQIQLLENEKALKTIGMCITKIRNLSGEDITMVENNIPFLISFIKLFQRDGELIRSDPHNIRILTVEDIRADLEHLINTNRISWIQILHETIVGDEIDNLDNIKKFAYKLYELSRDPKEEFLWTMTTVARANNNSALERVTVSFAVLASSLLSIVVPLENYGLYDYSKRIMKMDNLDVSDAITDLSELYKPHEINTSHLIRGLSKKLDKLREIALQVITFDDIAAELYSIIQITDFNHNMREIDDLEDYIRNIGLVEI